MIVSYAHRFIFIKSRRIAGTSISVALAEIAGDDAIVSPLRPRDYEDLEGQYVPRNFRTVAGPRINAHMPASWVIETVGRETWDDFLTFSVERNPWDKAVSLYYYATARREVRPPFAEWLRIVPTERLTNFHLYAADGAVAVKRLLRYESLSDEWGKLCADLGIDRVELAWTKARYRPSETDDWRPMYDDASAKYVADVCAREIDLLGYGFHDALGRDRVHRPEVSRQNAARRIPLDVASDARTPAPEGELHTFFRQTMPEFVYPGAEEEELLRSLERTDALAWTRNSDFSSLGARLLRSGFFGATGSRESWIFDHMPKTGGSEFTAIAERRLYAHDHLYVRWPASWLGILFGRLERVALVHGHGARYAEQLAPSRNWKTAICVREPLELAISTYQQYVRGMASRGASAVSVEHWVEARIISAVSGFDLNRQVRWLGLDRVPTASLPQGMEPTTEDLGTITARAIRRLESCDLVGTPETVKDVFERLSRSAELRVRVDDPTIPPANASDMPSRRILEKLPADLLGGLRELTKHDRELFDRACAHPGRVF